MEDDLAKSALKRLRCYDWLKKQKQPMEPSTEASETNRVELTTS